MSRQESKSHGESMLDLRKGTVGTYQLNPTSGSVRWVHHAVAQLWDLWITAVQALYGTGMDWLWRNRRTERIKKLTRRQAYVRRNAKHSEAKRPKANLGEAPRPCVGDLRVKGWNARKQLSGKRAQKKISKKKYEETEENHVRSCVGECIARGKIQHWSCQRKLMECVTTFTTARSSKQTGKANLSDWADADSIPIFNIRTSDQ